MLIQQQLELSLASMESDKGTWLPPVEKVDKRKFVLSYYCTVGSDLEWEGCKYRESKEELGCTFLTEHGFCTCTCPVEEAA